MDFAADLYVGKIDEAKAEVRNGGPIAPSRRSPEFRPSTPPGLPDDEGGCPVFRPSTPPLPDGGPIFRPSTPPLPGGDEPTFRPSTPPLPGDEPTFRPSTPPLPGDEPTFRPTTPPGGGGGDDLWQPPGEGGDSNGGGFGDDAGGGSGMWVPPGTEDSGGGGAFGGDDAFGGGGGGGGDPFGGGGGGDGDWDSGTAFASDAPNPASRKRDHSDMDSNGVETVDMDVSKKFHSDTGASAADKFYSGLTRNMGTRGDSRLYHMRNFNGWVKATSIAELDPITLGGRCGNGKRSNRNPLRVLDLACGKGGDLGKWTLHRRGLQNYVGIDVARGSLKDAAIRARRQRHKLKNRCVFTCADLGDDVPGRPRSTTSDRVQKLLSWSLAEEAPSESGEPEFKEVTGGGVSPTDTFDVVSVQFAIHYMMQTKERASRFFQTVSQLLDVGGNLIFTTIDSRVVMDHMMNLGLNLHFDDEDEVVDEASSKYGAVVTVGGGGMPAEV